MKIIIKNSQEIDLIREGSVIWKQIRDDITAFVKEGVSGVEIHDRVKAIFKKQKLKSAFKGHKRFPSEICCSVGDVIIHGVPTSKPLQKGDKVAIDIGFIYKNIVIDSAFTLVVGGVGSAVEIVRAGREALLCGINAITPGSHVGDITHAIETFVNTTPFSIIDDFSGHGCGIELHEEPFIMNKGLKSGAGAELVPGMIICIEPMLLDQKDGTWKFGPNKFDVLTNEPNTNSCHWECMVLITEAGYETLTL